MLSFIGTLTQGVGELSPSAVLENIDLGLLVVTVVRDGLVKTAVIVVIMGEHVRLTALIIVRVRLHAPANILSLHPDRSITIPIL